MVTPKKKLVVFLLVAVVTVAAIVVTSVSAINGPPRESIDQREAPGSGIPRIQEPTDVVIVGGDITAGTPSGGNRGFNWTVQLARHMYARNTPLKLTVSASRGAGFTKVGEGGFNFEDALINSLQVDTEAVVILGEFEEDWPSLEAAVRSVLSVIEEYSDRARVFVIGPLHLEIRPAAEVMSQRDLYRRLTDQAGATFVDPIEESWFTDGNLKYVVPEGLYDGGHRFIAGKLVPRLSLVTDGKTR